MTQDSEDKPSYVYASSFWLRDRRVCSDSPASRRGLVVTVMFPSSNPHCSQSQGVDNQVASNAVRVYVEAQNFWICVGRQISAATSVGMFENSLSVLKKHSTLLYL